MAEQGNSSTLTPLSIALAPVGATTPIEGEYLIEIKDFDQGGKVTKLSSKLPESSDFRKWTLMTRAVMLKKGPWQKASLYDVFFGIVYADNLGLDIMRGDVFPTGEGRIGISNKAKIKMAQDTGNIRGIEVHIEDTGEEINLTGCVQKTDLECTVTIHVKDWVKPIVRKSRLSRWYKAKNPNWAGNPEHMLELNTVAHACEYVPGASLATEGDEAPPISLDLAQATELALLNAKSASEGLEKGAAKLLKAKNNLGVESKTTE